MKRIVSSLQIPEAGGPIRGATSPKRLIVIAFLTIAFFAGGFSAVKYAITGDASIIDLHRSSPDQYASRSNGFDDTIHYPFDGNSYRTSDSGEHSGAIEFLAWTMALFLIASPLAYFKRLTTHTVRDWIVWPFLVFNWIVFGVGAVLCVVILISGGSPNALRAAFSLAVSSLSAIIFLTLMMPPILAFAIPSSRYSIWFWILSMMTFFSPYTILAGLWFPPYRRLKEYWRPRRLPRLPPSQSGMTLIELLIAVAILAILSVSISVVSGIGSQTTARQERRREALDLAEDAFAQLRAMPALPAAGVHPIDGAAAELHPDLKNKAQYAIAPGPRPGTSRVDLTIEFNDDLDLQTINLVAILPSEASR